MGYFSRFMTKEEAKASLHWTSCYKNGAENEPEKISETMRTMLLRRGWLTEDPAILSLLEDGIEVFRQRTAERIAREHASEIQYNLCPNC
ncbi:hypothetical protein SAMN05421823_10870 [Catalinimonas alkaloidigena]|uniref:Uncharacterized protein n=2 Tax=Catalinimonas alkaloidigena TaxID=1075417 RepID=A0A1G9MRU3_9BACT|nr:hypothetical protein SAMN05421823_10870 [Catalinimonas alkaloidigena]